MSETQAAKLMIGTPCYGGNITSRYFHAMLRLLPLLEARGIGHHIVTRSNESLITRARNSIVAEFLGRPEYTHLMFIDADIGFAPEAVLRLLDIDQPLAATAYPMKNVDWNEIHAHARLTPGGDVLRARAMRYAVNVQPGEHGLDRGFLKADAAGTGFMLIRREVFTALMAALPELRYRNDIAGYENAATKDNFWLFFDTLHDPETGRYLSEDYAFCHRWRKACGGEIWLDVDTELTHFGNFDYRGRFLDKVRPPGRE